MSDSSEATDVGRIEVRNDVDNRFYEIRVDGESAGVLVYEEAHGRKVFTHAFIEESYRGRGLATELIRSALDDIRDEGNTADSYCPIVNSFVAERPEYAGVVTAVRS